MPAKGSTDLTARDFVKLRSTSLADPRSPETTESDIAGPRDVDISRSLESNLAPVLQRLEREYLQSVLRRNVGRVGDAALQAGISRRTLLRKMKQYGLDKRTFKS